MYTIITITSTSAGILNTSRTANRPTQCVIAGHVNLPGVVRKTKEIIKTLDKPIDGRTRFSGVVSKPYTCLRLRFPLLVVLCLSVSVWRTEKKQHDTRTLPNFLSAVCKHESVRHVLGGGVYRAGADAADDVGPARELARGGRGGERGGQRCRRWRFGPVQRPGALGGGHIRHAGQEVGRSGVRMEGDQPSEPGGSGPVRGGRHTAPDRHGPERAEGCVVQMAQGHHPVRDQPLFL